jgi:hypothetical protein
MSSDVRRWAPGFQPIYAPVQRNQHVVLHEKSFLIRAARFQKRGGGGGREPLSLGGWTCG